MKKIITYLGAIGTIATPSLILLSCSQKDEIETKIDEIINVLQTQLDKSGNEQLKQALNTQIQTYRDQIKSQRSTWSSLSKEERAAIIQQLEATKITLKTLYNIAN